MTENTREGQLPEESLIDMMCGQSLREAEIWRQIGRRQMDSALRQLEDYVESALGCDVVTKEEP